MHKIWNPLLVLLVLVIALPQMGASQNSSLDTPNFEVNPINQPLAISQAKFQAASSLTDLNPHFKTSWVKEYHSVEITANHEGKTQKASSNSDLLTQEQKDLMASADLNTDISVTVHYLPDNSLKHNDSKELEFSFRVNPENDAKYIGEAQSLTSYLESAAIDKIPAGSFTGFALAAVTFTIDETGKVTQPKVAESSGDASVDEMLLETIRTMPNWEPASYANGTKVAQEFAFTVGNPESCVMNLLGVRRD